MLAARFARTTTTRTLSSVISPGRGCYLVGRRPMAMVPTSLLPSPCWTSFQLFSSSSSSASKKHPRAKKAAKHDPKNKSTRTTAAAASTSTSSTNFVQSKRRQFKQIPVNPKLLQSIRDQQVCQPMRQARTRKLNRIIHHRAASSRHHGAVFVPSPLLRRQRPPPPPPFGPTALPVRVRYSMRVTDTDPAGALDRLNPHKIPTVALCGRSNVGT